MQQAQAQIPRVWRQLQPEPRQRQVLTPLLVLALLPRVLLRRRRRHHRILQPALLLRLQLELKLLRPMHFQQGQRRRPVRVRIPLLLEQLQHQQLDRRQRLHHLQLALLLLLPVLVRIRRAWLPQLEQQRRLGLMRTRQALLLPLPVQRPP